jgi:hypothetical protein
LYSPRKSLKIGKRNTSRKGKGGVIGCPLLDFPLYFSKFSENRSKYQEVWKKQLEKTHIPEGDGSNPFPPKGGH